MSSQINKEHLKHILEQTYGLENCFSLAILTNNEIFFKFLCSLTGKSIINKKLLVSNIGNTYFTLDSFLLGKVSLADLYIPNNEIILGSSYIYHYFNCEKEGKPQEILTLLRTKQNY